MNRYEAKLALSEGKKLTHNSFYKGEFIYLECINPNTTSTKYGIIFEDGTTQDENEFWSMRDGYQWDNGWKIFS